MYALAAAICISRHVYEPPQEAKAGAYPVEHTGLGPMCVESVICRHFNALYVLRPLCYAFSGVLSP